METFDAYRKWLGIPAEERPPNYYRLLGIPIFEADQDVIANAVDQRMAHVGSYQGRHPETVKRILEELTTARICLRNLEMKATYDQQLRSNFARNDTKTQEAPLAGPPKPAVANRAVQAAPRDRPQPPPVPLPMAMPLALPSAGHRERRRARANFLIRWAIAGMTLGVLGLVALVFLFLRGDLAWILGKRHHEKAAQLAEKSPDDESSKTPEAAVRPVNESAEKGFHNSVGMDLVLIAPGKFMMGINDADAKRILADPSGDHKSLSAEESSLIRNQAAAERPQHLVVITKPYYLGTCEVTQGQFTRVMGKNPSWFASEGGGKEAVGGEDTSRLPVERVAWADAAEFCRRLSLLPMEKTFSRTYRLPTEAEWEYACRAGSTTDFCYGDDNASLADYAWYADTTKRSRTFPVGGKKANAWGLFDMHGNASEWCVDPYAADYNNSQTIDPQGPASSDAGHVARGGNWSSPAGGCRSAFRSSDKQADSSGAGFRVACVVETAGETGAPASKAVKTKSVVTKTKVKVVRKAAGSKVMRTALFDDRTLAGWHLLDPKGPDCWTVTDGTIVCQPRPDADGKNLVSNDQFHDFDLQLEFYLEPGADSGVFLRGIYEIQLFDDKSARVAPTQRCGAIFNQYSPSVEAYLGPKTWNSLDVKMVGNEISVVMNGKRIIENETVQGPTSDPALSIDPGGAGPIMLQCLSPESASRFRNISIQPLD